jgi:hypothetical protein
MTRDEANETRNRYLQMVRDIGVWQEKVAEELELHRKQLMEIRDGDIAKLRAEQSPIPKASQKIPKVNANIGTIKKLTKSHASKGRGVWEWLSNFKKQTDLYVKNDTDRVAYLLSSAYVDPAVWEDILKLYPEDEEYTFEKLVDLLDKAYPDSTPEYQRINEFITVKQKQPLVEVYNLRKKTAWIRAYGDVDPADRSDYISHWIEGIHPMIKQKLNRDVEVHNLTYDQPLALNVLEQKAFVYYCTQKNKPQYQSAFRSNANTVQSTDGEVGAVNSSNTGERVCHYFNRPVGCNRGQNCPFVHQANQNANAIESGITNTGARQNSFGQRNQTDNRQALEYPARGTSVPNSPCIPCHTNDPSYDGHVWVDCKKATCKKCNQIGHTRHRCPTITCNQCDQTGHTAFAHLWVVGNV